MLVAFPIILTTCDSCSVGNEELSNGWVSPAIYILTRLCLVVAAVRYVHSAMPENNGTLFHDVQRRQ
ncbi:hypothetical protein EGR_10971 [Echinococcus granulosus]|uniref:Uncharacterized protein n=1 Tax=Echinococcus granulosus TaxID=6210 RepID=W6TZE0_ECHGR|nr:hypothetical protein EGR_10971 [Echinococcus granulosus]EUB54175.1 hypothetical protein EGR_10971 [Echinococcus granulosus]